MYTALGIIHWVKASPRLVPPACHEDIDHEMQWNVHETILECGRTGGFMSFEARFGEGLTGFVGRQVGVTRGQVCRAERVLAVRGGMEIPLVVN